MTLLHPVFVPTRNAWWHRENSDWISPCQVLDESIDPAKRHKSRCFPTDSSSQVRDPSCEGLTRRETTQLLETIFMEAGIYEDYHLPIGHEDTCSKISKQHPHSLINGTPVPFRSRTFQFFGIGSPKLTLHHVPMPKPHSTPQASEPQNW